MRQIRYVIKADKSLSKLTYIHRNEYEKFRRKNVSFVFLNYRNISIEKRENIKNVLQCSWRHREDRFKKAKL